MLDNFIELAPAKINLFLKILSKRDDNYFNIRSGITFINLYDEIEVIKSSQFKVFYEGEFAPNNNLYKDCIIERLFKLFKIQKPKYHFVIKKNIPVQAGLGSASSNAAAIFRILEKLKIFKINNIRNTKILGSDVPLFINNKDCLIRGVGEKIINKNFPKYFFLLIKPSLNFSTKSMYNLIQTNDLDYNIERDQDEINELDSGNDFEKIIKRSFKDIDYILEYLKDFDNSIYTRVTGSGSCCYSVFDNKNDALTAQSKFFNRFPSLWTYIAENNI